MGNAVFMVTGEVKAGELRGHFEGLYVRELVIAQIEVRDTRRQRQS